MKKFIKSLLVAPLVLCASSAMAIPKYQIGDADGGVCDSYDLFTEDCLVTGEFTLTSLVEGGAFLVISTIPMDTSDNFTVAPSSDDNGALTEIWSGSGAPPISDDNTLAPHGIFDTYAEVYAVSFDDPADGPGTVYNTQPGNEGDMADGFIEHITLNLSWLAEGTGIHLDLFACTRGTTIGADGDCYVSGQDFAPFSHDATYVPVPAAVWLFGSGLIGLVAVARRRKNV